MSDNGDNGDASSVGIAHSRSRREKPKKVTNRLAALAALRATRDSGKKHLAEIDDFKVMLPASAPFLHCLMFSLM